MLFKKNFNFFLVSMFVLGELFATEVMVEDKLVYKVSGQVFTVNDLKSIYKSGKVLDCLFNNSLVDKVFSDFFEDKNLKYFKINKKFTSKQIEYFNDSISLMKLYMYRKSFSVQVKKELKKYLVLKAKTKKCTKGRKSENQSLLRGEVLELLKMEIFLRDRFLPVEIQRVSTKQEVEKAASSAKNFLRSIGEQLEQEVYW